VALLAQPLMLPHCKCEMLRVSVAVKGKYPLHAASGNADRN